MAHGGAITGLSASVLSTSVKGFGLVVIFASFSLLTPEQLHGDRDDPLRLKAEFALQLLKRCRRAEGLHADNAAGGADISVPTEHRSLLDGDACRDMRRQDLLAIGLRLVLEDVPRGHRDDPRAK